MGRLNYSASFQARGFLLMSSLQTGPRVAYLYYFLDASNFTLSSALLFIALCSKNWGSGAVHIAMQHKCSVTLCNENCNYTLRVSAFWKASHKCDTGLSLEFLGSIT